MVNFKVVNIRALHLNAKVANYFQLLPKPFFAFGKLLLCEVLQGRKVISN